MAEKKQVEITEEEILNKLAEAFFKGFKDEIQKEKELMKLADLLLIEDEYLW